MDLEEALWYWCENEACPEYDDMKIVPRGEEATCPVCGQFMHAAYDVP